MTKLLSAILPTKGRGPQALRCINRLFETIGDFDLELFIIAHPDESNEVLKPLLANNFSWANRIMVHLEFMDIKPLAAYNWAAERAAGTHLFDFDDDAWFYDDWLKRVFDVFDAIPNGHGYVKIQSDSQNYWAERAIGNRDFYKEVLGGVISIPKYHSQYNDVEKSDRAIRAGLFFESQAYIEHRHWCYGKAEKDATYLDGGIKYVTEDHNMYASRKAAGFPNDYAGVIK